MAKRKTIGHDPLDWIGEAASRSSSAPGIESTRRVGGGAANAGNGNDPFDANAGASQLSLASASTGSSSALSLDRQLLLVDDLTRHASRRPRTNHVLWTLLLLLSALGIGIVFFRETRKHWEERLVSLRGELQRVEGDRGRNEAILAQVIDQKEKVIREKQSTIATMESLHDSIAGELRLARDESRKLKSQNESLFEKLIATPVPVPIPSSTGGVDETREKP